MNLIASLNVQGPGAQIFSDMAGIKPWWQITPNISADGTSLEFEYHFKTDIIPSY